MTIDTTTTGSVIEQLEKHLAANYGDPSRLRAISQQFRREGYVKLTGLVPPEVFTQVRDEVYRLIDLHARRIDILMEQTGNSPRFMSTVSRRAIAEEGSLIPQIYECTALTDVLSTIARQPVLSCPWDDEKYVIIRQHKQGDTHGWHWGDFSFTVIWIIEAPGLEAGGMLQCVPHTDWDKQNPQVHQYLVDNVIRTYPHATGDLYLLRSDTTLHRTVPLIEDRTRIILNTCWASENDLLKANTHETMHAMFE